MNGGGYSYIYLTPYCGYTDTAVTNGQSYQYEIAAIGLRPFLEQIVKVQPSP